MIFNTSDYKSRVELDQAVRIEVGTELKHQKKVTNKIIGTSADLKRLHLSAATSVFGVTVEANEEE